MLLPDGLPLWSRRAALLVAGALALAGCRPPPEPRPLQPTTSPQCERATQQRARVPGLLAEGRLDRAVRVIQAADELCPAGAPSTWPDLAQALADLGRWDDAERVAGEIDRGAAKSPEIARRVQAVRDRVRALRDRKPDPERLYALGLAAKARGEPAEAQRWFDRALVDLQRVASERVGAEPPVVLDAPNLLAGGAVKHTFSTHAAPVLDAAWSFDGRVVASTSEDGVLRLLRDGAPLHLSGTPRVPPIRGRHLSTLSLSHDGRTVAAVCADAARPGSIDTLCLWDTATGVETRWRPVPGLGIAAVALSPDATWVAVAEGDQVVRILDARTRRTVRELPEVCDARDALKACPMTILRWSPDGRLLAGGAGALGVLWDVETGARRRIERRVDAPFAFRPDGGALGTARYDHPILDPRAGGPWREIPAPDGVRVTAVAFDPLGERFAEGGEDGRVHLLDARTERAVALLRGAPWPVSALAFGPSGRLLLVASEEGSLDFWSVGDGRLAATVRAVHGTEAGYALAAGHIETWGEAARRIPICRAGPESLPFEACADRFESRGLLGRVLRGEPLGLDP